METTIQKTLMQWFPEAFSDLKKNIRISDYEALRIFSRYTIEKIHNDSENKTEPFKIIFLLYSKGSLFERNAIENEFLKILSDEEQTGSLKEHLSLMPDELKAVYIKTILEN